MSATFYSFRAPTIGRVDGPVSVASIWDRRWRGGTVGARFLSALRSGDYLKRRVRRRTRRGFRMAMCLALMGVLVGVGSRTLNLAVVATLGASFRGVSEGSVFNMGPAITLDGWDNESLPSWTDRPVNTDEWSPITMSNPEVSASIYSGVVGEFLRDRADLADIHLLIGEAHDRVPHAVAMSLADLSESIGASLRMGMTKDEVAAIIRLCSEYVFTINTNESGTR